MLGTQAGVVAWAEGWGVCPSLCRPEASAAGAHGMWAVVKSMRSWVRLAEFESSLPFTAKG